MQDSTAGRGGLRTSASGAPRGVERASGRPPRVPDQRGDRHRGEPPRPRRRRGLRILKWLSIGTALLVLGTAGAGYAYYRHLNGNIRKGERSIGRTTVKKAKPNSAGQSALNILLLGSDSRNSSDDVALGGSKENAGGPARADVEMLLHVSADRQHAAIVSIPRDTRVDIPQCTDPATGRTYPPVNDIINASLARGGPGCTLATWQNLTGVYIDHWMMVDFEGVVKMADAIGGVDVCVRENLWDRHTSLGGTGLKLTAGTHRVSGKQALQWLRTRDAFGSDLGRAQAQHMYLASMMRELRSQNIFTDPTRLTGLAETATKSLEVSKEIGTVSALYDLGEQLKSVPPDRITMTTMPNIPDPQDPQAHLLPDPASAPTLWSMLRDDVPLDDHGSVKPGATPTPTPSGPAADAAGRIPVTVVNGTAGSDGVAVQGRAGAITATLRGDGFTQASTSPGASAQSATTLDYPAALGAQGKADALAVAKSLGIPAGSVKPSQNAAGITLTVGADWTSGSSYATTLPTAGKAPGQSLNASDTGACMPVYAPYQW